MIGSIAGAADSLFIVVLGVSELVRATRRGAAGRRPLSAGGCRVGFAFEVGEAQLDLGEPVLEQGDLGFQADFTFGAALQSRERAARSRTASSGTSRCGPFGPSTRREGISRFRYQARSAERDTPASASATASGTQWVSSSWASRSSSCQVLSVLGIGLAATRTDVERLVGRGEGAPNGHIPFTPQAKKVLELSLREALGLGHNYIGTEHILLGLMRDGQGPAMTVLEERGATPANVRPLVQAALERAVSAKGTPQAPPADRRTVGADAVIAAAQQLAGAGPMGSHHLLEAMALVEDSLASGALVALGVDADALAAKIDELGTEGTTDLSPEETGAQHMELRMGDDEVVIVMRDATMLELGRMLSGVIGSRVAGTTGTASPLVGLWLANLVALRELLERVDRGRRPTRAAARRSFGRRSATACAAVPADPAARAGADDVQTWRPAGKRCRQRPACAGRRRVSVDRCGRGCLLRPGRTVWAVSSGCLADRGGRLKPRSQRP